MKIYKTTNINKKIEKDINPFINKLKECNYIEGIVLLGGLGKRNFSDKYSDVDICLFYDNKIMEEQHLPFEFHYEINNKIYEFNIRELYYDEEASSEWDEFKKEAYSRSNVILDRKERIKSLIARKTEYNSELSKERLIYIMQQYQWRGQIHTIRSYHRGFPEASILLINECIELLIEAVYIINGKYRSHPKWRISNLLEMNLIPKNMLKNIRSAMLVKNFSLKDLKRRIKALDNIYNPLKEIIYAKYKDFPQDPYVYTYRNKYQLVPLTFSQKMKEKYRKRFPDINSDQLEALICINLVQEEKELQELFLDNQINL